MNNPEVVPINAKTEERINNLLKSFVNKFAVACGMVNSDRIKIIPTTRIFKTTVSAIMIIVR
jgi:hypothetical protein